MKFSLANDPGLSASSPMPKLLACLRLQPLPGSPRAAQGLVLVLVCLFGLAFAGPLPAYTPLYLARKVIRPNDLHAGVSSPQMTVTGFSAAGQVIGYLSYAAQGQGVSHTDTEAFLWGDQSAALTNLNTVLGATSSLATCVNSTSVAGVYWSGAAANPQQLGFLFQSGYAQTIHSPDGGGIDAVTAVSNSGWVIGTYYGPYGLKRAFVWDGYDSYDLGDFGDPENSFVWPRAFSLDGATVLGNVYAPDGTVDGITARAFLWQLNDDTGTAAMLPLAGMANYSNVEGLGFDSQGGVAGNYSKPSPTSNGHYDVAGFYWKSGVVQEPGTLSKNHSATAFSISPGGVVTGIAYGADQTLHLVDWQPGGTLRDLGTASLHAGDANCQLTSVSEHGVIGGIITDAGGVRHPCVRLDGRWWDLGAVADPAAGFTADTGPAAQVFVHDDSQVACAGRSQGVPAVFLLTQDADNDGLPDGWEMQYFHSLAQTGDGDYDGDGLTNEMEYLGGTDPTEYYNGQLPTFRVVGGGDQRGAPGDVLPQPVSVRVGTNGAQSAPLSYRVTAGDALIANSAGGPFRTSVQTSATVPYTDGGGVSTYAAQVWVKLPAANGRSTVTITATSGTQSAGVSTTEIASDPNVQPPGNFGIGKNAATAVDITWTPADPARATVAEVSYDAQATWQAVGTFAPGAAAGTVSHLAPDHVVYLRLYTAGDGGGAGSAPSGAGRAEVLSVPVVEGVGAGLVSRNNSFVAQGPGASPSRYRHGHVNFKHYEDFSNTFPDHIRTYLLSDLTYQKPPGDGFDEVTDAHDRGDPNQSDVGTILGEIGQVGNWTFDGPTTANLHVQHSTADDRYEATGSLDTLYPLAEFRAAAETAAAGVPFADDLTDGVATAWLHFQETPGTGEARSPFPFARGYDHTSDIERLHYRFRCNADPDGRVVYDVIFTPDDGGPVRHEAHQVPTHGRTEVGADTREAGGGPEPQGGGGGGEEAAKPKPFELDPVRMPGKPNGKYAVVPIALQPADWHFALAGGPVSFAGEQTGETGAMVPSTQGPTGALHYVSPKQAGGRAVIRAGLPRGVEFADYFEWKVTDAAGAEVGASVEGDQVSVGRDAPGRYVVRVMSQPRVPLAAQEITSLSVWIVWCDVTSSFVDDEIQFNQFPDGSRESRIVADFTYKATINPRLICSLNGDVPDLRTRKTNTPHYKYLHALLGTALGEVPFAWDLTRQWREKDLAATINGSDAGFPPTGALFGTLPNSNITQITSEDQGNDGYPSDEVEGNDDQGHSDQTPYGGSQYGVVITWPLLFVEWRGCSW